MTTQVAPRFAEADRRRKQIACAMVDMMLGTYTPILKGAKVRNAEGKPVINKRELMRLAGYAKGYEKQYQWEHPDLLGYVSAEMARREGNLHQALEEQRPVVDLLVGKMGAILAQRLADDPNAFSNEQLIRFMPAWLRLQRNVRSKTGEGNPQQVAGTIQNILVDVGDSIPEVTRNRLRVLMGGGEVIEGEVVDDESLPGS